MRVFLVTFGLALSKPPYLTDESQGRESPRTAPKPPKCRCRKGLLAVVMGPGSVLVMASGKVNAARKTWKQFTELLSRTMSALPQTTTHDKDLC